jgi:hypothetical protein
MSRQDEIIARIVSDLESEGVLFRKVREMSDGYDYDSYSDFMIDLRLNGSKAMTKQEVWEHQKRIINRITGQLLKLSKDYRKLERKFFNLSRDFDEILRENTAIKNEKTKEN